MEDESRDEEETVADDGDSKGKEKPWYPYITKTQFEKFLSRLESKIPDEIDRDYVRAIIRTPSMIYRFLRGVEAMGLIDDEQRPTDRLRSLVDRETRREALGQVVGDLYPALNRKMQEVEGEMADRDIVAFFRKETGMGNDSANKMKMFFKYLLSEADGDVASTEPAAPAEATEATTAATKAVGTATAHATRDLVWNVTVGVRRSISGIVRRVFLGVHLLSAKWDLRRVRRCIFIIPHQKRRNGHRRGAEQDVLAIGDLGRACQRTRAHLHLL